VDGGYQYTATRTHYYSNIIYFSHTLILHTLTLHALTLGPITMNTLPTLPCPQTHTHTNTAYLLLDSGMAPYPLILRSFLAVSVSLESRVFTSTNNCITRWSWRRSSWPVCVLILINTSRAYSQHTHTHIHIQTNTDFDTHTCHLYIHASTHENNTISPRTYL
jgi:hypothetical protein